VIRRSLFEEHTRWGLWYLLITPTRDRLPFLFEGVDRAYEFEGDNAAIGERILNYVHTRVQGGGRLDTFGMRLIAIVVGLPVVVLSPVSCRVYSCHRGLTSWGEDVPHATYPGDRVYSPTDVMGVDHPYANWAGVPEELTRPETVVLVWDDDHYEPALPASAKTFSPWLAPYEQWRWPQDQAYMRILPAVAPYADEVVVAPPTAWQAAQAQAAIDADMVQEVEVIEL
jgi:hypothetical protein